jgi:hypothetical protein
MMRLLIALFFTMISTVFETVAQPAGYCPKKIAIVQGDPLAIPAKDILRKIYKQMGCNVKILPLPGTRGILHFNKKRVDGELYRLPLAEKAYNREFIRSAHALLKLTYAIWENPASDMSDKKPLGYVRGIKWHEAYIQHNVLNVQKIAQFNTEEKMFEAFARGVLGSFLSEEQTVDLLLKNNKMHILPRLKAVIETKGLYHYLGAEFSDFMTDFSAVIKKDNPFSILE